MENPLSFKIVFFGDSIPDKNHQLRQLVGNYGGIGTKYYEHFDSPVKLLVSENPESDLLIIKKYLMDEAQNMKDAELAVTNRIKTIEILNTKEFVEMVNSIHKAGMQIEKPIKNKIKTLNYTAIDFETANNFRRSACSLGLVKVENGEIVERKYWLIKPTPFEMGVWQYRTHGISLESLIDKPDFSELLPEIKPYLENQLVIAHNGSSFDFSVLKYLFSHYDLTPFPIQTYCTLELSRLVWPNEVLFNLKHLVALKLNHTFNHHDALADAEACALLFEKILDEAGISTEEDLSNYIDKNYFKTSNRFRNVKQAKRSIDFSVSENQEHPFYAKEIVFTGEFNSFSRKEGESLVVTIGGIAKGSVTSKTKYLVVGQQYIFKVGIGLKSSKMKKVEDLISKGYDIQVLTESDFIEFLSQ